MDNDELKLLNVDQACECLGLGRWSIYKLIREGRLKSVQVGKRRLFTQGAIRKFIARLEEEGRFL